MRNCRVGLGRLIHYMNAYIVNTIPPKYTIENQYQLLGSLYIPQSYSLHFRQFEKDSHMVSTINTQLQKGKGQGEERK